MGAPRRQRAQGDPKRDAGKTGCALHPRSRVQNANQQTHTNIQVQRKQSGLPCAMVLTAYNAFSPATNSSCNRRASCSGQSDLTAGSSLDASNGRQDHATSPSASNIVVSVSLDCSQPSFEDRPACPTLRPTPKASTASRPAFVTIASRPPEGRDNRRDASDLAKKQSGKFFATGLDMIQVICPTGCFRSNPSVIAS